MSDKTLEDYHNDGQEDAASGSGYNPPVDSLLPPGMGGELSETQQEKNDAHKDGYDHGKEQRGD